MTSQPKQEITDFEKLKTSFEEIGIPFLTTEREDIILLCPCTEDEQKEGRLFGTWRFAERVFVFDLNGNFVGINS